MTCFSKDHHNNQITQNIETKKSTDNDENVR